MKIYPMMNPLFYCYTRKKKQSSKFQKMVPLLSHPYLCMTNNTPIAITIHTGKVIADTHSA
jgi:hypothetical protein